MNLASLYAIHSGSANNTHDCWKDCHFSFRSLDGIPFVLLICSAIISGISVGIAWAAAGAFITKTAAVLSSHDTNFAQEQRKIFRCLDCLWNGTFHVLAGNLTSFFNVILIGVILVGHVFSYYSLQPIDDGPHVQNTYVIVCVTSIFSSLLMIFLVKDPAVQSVTSDDVSTTQQNQNIIQEGNDTMNHHRESDSGAIYFVDRVMMTIKEPQLMGLMFVHLTSGVCEGVVLCWVGAKLVPQASMIGYLAAVKNIAAATVSPLYSMMGNKAALSWYTGRINVILIGQFFYLMSILLIIYDQRKTNESNSTTSTEEQWWTLLSIYTTAGIGFSMWQGTAGGAFLSEIGTYLSTTINAESDIIITAAFSGCKAISGTATALIFIYFSSNHYNNIPPFLLLLCTGTCCLGMIQIHMGRQKGIWNPTISFTSNHGNNHTTMHDIDVERYSKSVPHHQCDQAKTGESKPLLS